MVFALSGNGVGRIISNGFAVCTEVLWLDAVVGSYEVVVSAAFDDGLSVVEVMCGRFRGIVWITLVRWGADELEWYKAGLLVVGAPM